MDSASNSSFGGQKRKVVDMSSDEDDARPPTAFRGFARAPSRSESPPSFGLGSARQNPWNERIQSTGTRSGNATGPGLKGANSFAARMMAKMGYKEGQGLGSTGQGIVNPIEAQARPQGIGLGAVREKTKQAKDEEKRTAARRGEEVEDSSDEERKRRQKKKAERRQRDDRSETGTPIARAKHKFRTAREMEEDMDGLEVPNVLKTLVDATGKEQRVLTSTAGLMTGQEFVSQAEGEAAKIARRARHDLEAFADEWKGLTERKKYIEMEEAQTVDQLDTSQQRIDQFTELIAAVGNLELFQEENTVGKFDEVASKLEALEARYREHVDEYRLSETAVAAIHPLFRQAMEEWEPLNDPTFLLSHLRRLQPLLSQKTGDDPYKPRQSTSPYETMIYALWLPRVRSALLNDWDVFDPNPATTLVISWKDFLPVFVYTNLLDQLIVPKLSSGIKQWKPSSRRRHHTSSSQDSKFPWWLFTWLQYLDDRHTNPKQPTGLMSDVKRKFRGVLDTWDLRRGVIPGIELWKESLGSEFDSCLRNHFLPRLARYLREDFHVNPADQDMGPLEDIFKWESCFAPNVLGLLLVAEFFPKWHYILYIWLTNDPNYEEVGEWFSWWRGQIPPHLNDLTIVDEEWKKGLQTMDLASRLGDRAATDLPAPTTTTTTTTLPDKPQPTAQQPAPEPPRKPRAVEEIAFKDILESWCTENGLLIIPLREAHPQNGQPLFRITASATGRGGVVSFVLGDVVWVRDRKAREVWEPVELGEGLVDRAEGR